MKMFLLPKNLFEYFAIERFERICNTNDPLRQSFSADLDAFFHVPYLINILLSGIIKRKGTK